MDIAVREVTHVTLITLERVCLSWRVALESPHTVNNLLSMSVGTQCYVKKQCIWMMGIA